MAVFNSAFVAVIQLTMIMTILADIMAYSDNDDALQGIIQFLLLI